MSDAINSKMIRSSAVSWIGGAVQERERGVWLLTCNNGEHGVILSSLIGPMYGDPLLALVAVSAILSAASAVVATPAHDRNIQTIAFGSCSTLKRPQPMWKTIANTDPELWVWLGDAVYVDKSSSLVFCAFYLHQK